MEDKMTTTTVIAKDTSSAMDDIMSKLGDDAVILSTKHKALLDLQYTNENNMIAQCCR